MTPIPTRATLFTDRYPAPPVPPGPPVYSYIDLCAKMKSRERVTIVDRSTGKKITGMVNGIAPESGDGKQWIVTLCTENNENVDVYVKTD
jgi:hypothetical protein